MTTHLRTLTRPPLHVRARLTFGLLTAAALLAVALVATAPPGAAAAPPGAAAARTAPLTTDGPGVGAPWVVTLGDSYISGEAGRWAGASNRDHRRADALGRTAYLDNPDGTAELIPRCHRASSAEAYIGGGINGLNLACSGATTATSTGSPFKPGIDFYDGTAGQGQALMLQEAAATRNVRMVVVSIGGNDFGFADVVQTCVVNFLTSPSWWKNYCHDDGSVARNFTPENVAQVRARVTQALGNVATAMSNAGYTTDQWTLVVQTYPSPVPDGSGFRYAESGYTRQTVGGCGLWNRDADWANATALPTINGALLGAAADVGLPNVRTLDMTHAFDGKRLCETGVGLYEEVGLADWRAPGAVDRTEWVNQIRTVSTIGDSPYYVQESLHPSYWGQLAMRNCLRQVWNDGAPRSGSCTVGDLGTARLTSSGEPRMHLTPLP
ncbi:hypothetical protein ACFQBY_14935 [Promicromonospora citrea]|uniref:GDSL-like lipase/acylhydrolase family protein n=1 Tax=Promicromonospora citrea TaxID=43677 RepID=A0A8H9GLG5_9MICO|nr:hypothetical protein [Promicromonospora citrea]NNH53467.1 hypothetical protein [Promicromonospora citrea]GGM36647.1 hypothetical protein GCM10010102_35040 [Promicromonospora citrea]